MMSLAERWIPWVLLCLVSCGPSTTPPSPVPGVGGSGGAVNEETLEFRGANPMPLPPGKKATLKVQLTPPRITIVHFSLTGDFVGASLSSGEQASGEDGLATIELRAPHIKTNFGVRASADSGATGEQKFTIVEDSLASVMLQVLYHGHRNTSQWEASLLEDATPCSVDGEGKQAIWGTLPLLYKGLPANRPLHLRIRAGKLVFGCATLAPLQAEKENQIEVLVKNAPATSLKDIHLSMQLHLDSKSWPTLLKEWSQRIQDSFQGGRTEDPEAASALLDTMLVLASNQQRPSLLLARSNYDWDNLLTQRFSVYGGPAIFRNWLIQAQKELQKSPGILTGDLKNKSEGSAIFSPKQAFLLQPQDFLPNKPFSWKLDAGDTLIGSSELRFRPSVLLQYTIEKQQKEGGSDGPLQQLEQRTDCVGLSEDLMSVVTTPMACEAPCLATLCNAALTSMWQRATSVDEQNNSTATLAFTVSGAALLDESARVRSFQGSWVGQLKDSQVVGVSVAAQGSAASIPSP